MTAAFDTLRPFAWLALIAFLVGFCSYLLFAQPSPAVAQEEMRAIPTASGPVSDDWNVAKHI